MAARSGTAGSVTIYTGGSETVVGAVQEWNILPTAEVLDLTAFGESDRRYIPGVKAVTGSFSAQFDYSDTGQAQFASDALTGAKFRGLFYEDDSALIEAVTGKINGWSPALSFEGVEVISYDFTLHESFETDQSITTLKLEDATDMLREDGAPFYLEGDLVW